MPEPKMGGQKVLRLCVSESDDIIDSLFSIQYGGRKLEKGLRELVQEKYASAFEIELIRDGGSPLTRQADVVVLSLQPAVAGPVAVEEFKQSLIEQIREIKRKLNAHVIIYNCSSVDPDDNIDNYYGRPDTFTIRVHRFNLALMQVSVLEGVSFIDVERLIGQLAGERHVEKPLHYSAEAYQAMCQEFLRVLEDIGFFEKRPLVMQVGQAGTAK